MTREEAEEYAKDMTYRDAVYNALQGKCIPYRKATLIKLYELLDKLEQEPCEDAISRQAALEIQAKYAEHIRATKFWQMRDDIKALLPVNPQPKWIPVSEGFPKTEQYAFITVYNQTEMCWYQNGVFVDGKQNTYTKENEELVAWMPFQIPKPYKAESEPQESEGKE